MTFGKINLNGQPRIQFAALVIILATGNPLWAQRGKTDGPRPPMGGQSAKFYEKKQTEGKLAYWVMKPKGYDKTRQYPLVLCLHGHGGSTTAANVLASQAMRTKYPCIVVAPAVDRTQSWATRTNAKRPQTKPALKEVIKAIEATRKEFSIDPARLYVTGQSMGGAGTFGTIAGYADLFAAAVPVCGGWIPGDAPKMKGVNFWVFHGDKDKVVPTEYSRAMVQAFKKQGISVKYTEYEGVAHNSWTKAYADQEMWKWLFEQKKKTK